MLLLSVRTLKHLMKNVLPFCGHCMEKNVTNSLLILVRNPDNPACRARSASQRSATSSPLLPFMPHYRGMAWVANMHNPTNKMVV